MKKILIIFTLIVLLNSTITLASSRTRDSFVSFREETDSVNCGDILTSNTILTSDLVCAGDGLIIGANNVVLDCDGHSITYAESEVGYGISSNGKNNLEIKNCNLIKGAWDGNSNFAIRIDNSDNSVIESNIISIESTKMNYGIRIEGNNNIINNNNIDLTGYHCGGIGVSSPSQENQVFDNVLQVEGVECSGISLWDDSLNCEIYNNSISNADWGIYINGAGSAPDGTYISNNDLINIQTWDLLIDEDADDVILEDQPVGKYNIVDSNIIVKKTGIGEVWLDEDFTVSGDNLDEDISVEDNDISIDIVNKPGLNVSGKIVLYDPTTQFFAPYYALENSGRCTAPYSGVCTNFEKVGSEYFSFDVSEMALEYKVEGSTAPVPEEKQEMQVKVVVRNTRFKNFKFN